MKLPLLPTAFLLFTNGFLFGQNYIPFPTDSACWISSLSSWSMGFGTRQTWQEDIGGDTLLNGVLFHQVALKKFCALTYNGVGIPPTLETDLGLQSAVIGGIREQDKKIYFKKFETPPGFWNGFWEPYLGEIPNGQEVLLYDFNWQLNDLFQMAYTNWTFKIIEIKTDNGRKKFKLENQNGIHWTKDVYEGMGSDLGLFGCYDDLLSSPAPEISCVTIGGIVVQESWLCEQACPEAVSTVESGEIKVQVNPNPASQRFCISSSVENVLFKLSIWDLYGKLIRQEDKIRGSYCLDWAELPGLNVAIVGVQVPGHGSVLRKVIRVQ